MVTKGKFSQQFPVLKGEEDNCRQKGQLQCPQWVETAVFLKMQND
jgi:hypothetical protein